MKRESISDLGLNFVVGLSGSELSDKERDILSRLRPAGIILFKHNIAKEESPFWQERLIALISEARGIIGRSSVVVSIDHEGGKVHRFPRPVTHFPVAAKWADKAFEVGSAMAQELRALGINLSFSPVLDVNTESKNPVIGERAFSSDAKIVAEVGREFVRGLESSGVVACGKHFPGHGSTTADSHLELPVVSESRQVLSAREVLPFRALIDHGLRMIMTAHVCYSALDQGAPATLSKIILQGLLRSELGFSGVIISDDLNMKALNFVTVERRGLECLKAGVDLLLMGNAGEVLALDLAEKMANEILVAVRRREISKESVEASQKRVVQLLGDLEAIQLAAGEMPTHEIIGCKSHQQLCSALS